MVLFINHLPNSLFNYSFVLCTLIAERWHVLEFKWFLKIFQYSLHFVQKKSCIIYFKFVIFLTIIKKIKTILQIKKGKFSYLKDNHFK